MLDALYISAIGLQAQKEQLDALAGNLANIGTTAFKRQTVDFSAILDRSPAGTDALSMPDARPNRLLRVDLTPGPVHATARPLDIAIVGSGFIEVQLPGDRIGYSRGGSLQINPEGGLSLANGMPLKADIRVPAGANDLQIRPDGSVIATLAGDPTATVLGQIELATFANPDSLQYRGEGVFMAPDGAADPIVARPGEEGTALLATQSLEGANVNMTDEMVALMLMQRVYELNSRVAQVADELMGMSNNMRRE
jgi:flagellar basal-body rod protein FlgG